MNDLMCRLLEAHGGLGRWETYRSVEANLTAGGALWGSNSQADLVAKSSIRASLTSQHVALLGLGGGALDASVTASQVRLRETPDGAERTLPSPAGILGAATGGRWDTSEAAFFHGYAMWTYMVQPFLWGWAGFIVREIEPWREDGEDWRRLEITFPDTIARHSQRQIAYIGPDGMLRRFDYAVDRLGGSRGAHYPTDYRPRGGVLVSHRRRVHPIGPDGHKLEDVVLVSVDLEHVRFL